MEDDSFNEFIVSTMKLLTGTNAQQVAADLEALKSLPVAEKEEFATICITAAVGVRKNVEEIPVDRVKDVTGDSTKAFKINGRWNFAKLACAGNMILEESDSNSIAVLQKGMQNRIGSKSIFSMLLIPNTVSITRAKILSENKNKWGLYDKGNVGLFLKNTRFVK